MNCFEKTTMKSIRQIGMVVRDLAEFMDNMRRLYGLDPDRTAYYPKDSDESTCQRKIAFYNFPEVELEVIEPIRSMKMWHDFLDKHGNCLQHIQFNVDNLAETIKRMESCGASIIERGHSIINPKVEFVFFDTLEQFGYVTEVVNFKEMESGH